MYELSAKNDRLIELFKPYIDEGREIVCFSISSSMSTSGNVMRIAAEELEAEDRITVIDSANLSTGIGLLVIEAAIMAQNNHTVEEIVSAIEALKPNVRASFVVDTLTYLYRGGRCNAVSAMAGGVLKLHPENRSREWCNECFKKISWKNQFCNYDVCQGYGG